MKVFHFQQTTCLKLAEAMVKLFGSSTVKCKEFGDWLITTLQEIIDMSQSQQGKKKGVIKQERVWSKYHQITKFSGFKISWETFLSDLQLEKEPVFYQYFTDDTFDILIKKAMGPVPEPLTNSAIPFMKRMPFGTLVVMLYEFCVNIKATVANATTWKQ